MSLKQRGLWWIFAAVTGLWNMPACGGGDVTTPPPATVVSRTSATIRWELPPSRVDGSPLIDLAGFKVYYADGSGMFYRVTDVGMETSLFVTGLPPRTYYFTVTAYDASLRESDPSNTMAVTFN